MKTFINSILIIVLFTICSCSRKENYENAKNITKDDFKNTTSLTGSALEFDSMVMRPISLHLYDSFLITINMRTDKVFHIFNRYSKQKIGERISMGQGPNEMIRPFFIANNDSTIQIFELMSSSIYEYSIDEFISNTDPNPIRKTKISELVYSKASVLDNNIIISTSNHESLFSFYDLDGKKKKEIGKYPISNLIFSNSEMVEAYRSSFVTNLKDRFFVCYGWTDLIEIYNKNGELLNRTHGPAHFFPKIKEHTDGNISSSNPIQGESMEAYSNPVNVGNEIFVLFKGYLFGEKNNDMTNQIFVFDWNGNPIRIYLLDQDIFTFTVDEVNHKIYGISDIPEFHIIEFPY